MQKMMRVPFEPSKDFKAFSRGVRFFRLRLLLKKRFEED